MSDTTWDITDNSTTYTFDAASAGSIPSITVGEEVTVELLLGERDGHVSTYEQFKDYEKHLNDKTLDYGTDYRGKPWYRFNLHPDATVSSYLFKVEPSAFITGASSFWGLLTGVSDNSTVPEANAKLELSFLVLTDGTADSRTTIINDYKAQL